MLSMLTMLSKKEKLQLNFMFYCLIRSSASIVSIFKLCTKLFSLLILISLLTRLLPVVCLHCHCICYCNCSLYCKSLVLSISSTKYNFYNW